MQCLADIEYADAYFKMKPDASAWDSLSDDDKNKQLMEASRRIYAVPGFKFTPDLIEVLSESPDDLKQVCCEAALGLLTSGSSANPHNINKKLGISSISFGRDSVSYADNTSSAGLDNAVFSEYAQSILNKYIIKAYPYV